MQAPWAINFHQKRVRIHCAHVHDKIAYIDVDTFRANLSRLNGNISEFYSVKCAVCVRTHHF